jgi:hypothetical protein
MPDYSPLGRALVVKPRRTGYKHRPIITVVQGVGLTEQGEIVRNLPLFATSMEPHIWCAFDVLSIMEPMREWFSDVDWFTWDFTDSRDPDLKGAPYMSHAKLSSFGFHSRSKSNGKRRKARHMVWEPSRMFSDPSAAARFLCNTHEDLRRFAIDVREWCREQDLQLRATLPSLAAQLLRDPRFWPHDRGRVPRATNEAIRRALPGVHQRRLAPLHQTIPLAVGLDQRRAYHRAAQEVPTPDPTTMHARGYFNEPMDAPLWCRPDDVLYQRTVSQPGVVAVRATARPARNGELRLPAVDALKGKRGVILLWTNELQYAIDTGLKVEGLTAAWTSSQIDTGLPLYGAFAEGEIDAASDFRASWLKPTLHSAYGMLGSRQREMIRLSRFGRGVPTMVLLQGQPFPVRRGAARTGASMVTNVAMLGVLQAEIRRRTLALAADLTDRGCDVLHVHADGLHVKAGPLPFTPPGWTAAPVTRLVYEDDVSWLSDERDVLPGRDTRMRVELRRHHAYLMAQRRSAA